MFKPFAIVPAIAILIVALAATVALAQSKQDGIKLFHEAQALHGKARSNDDLKKVVEKYEQALKIFEKVGDQKNLAATLNNLGNVFQGWGQNQKAVECYEKSLEIDRKLGHLKGQAMGLLNLGVVNMEWGQYQKAVEYYEKVMEITRKIGDVKTEGQALNNLGNVYRNGGQYRKAVEYYEKSLEIYRRLGDLKAESNCLNNLGKVYRHWGQYQKAAEYHEKSAEIARKLGAPQIEASALTELGNVDLYWGQYQKAADCYEKSLEIYRRLGDLKDESICLNNLGMVYRHWGQLTKAVDFFEKALEIKRKVGDLKTEAMTVACLADMYLDWGQYSKAMDFFEKALEINRKIGDIPVESDMLSNFGRVYSDWGQHGKAIEFFEKSLAIKRKIEDPQGEARTLNYLGNVYVAWGQYELALAKYRQSLAIYEKIGAGPAGWSKACIASAYLDMGDFVKAEPLVEEANMSMISGRFCLLKGDHAKAREYYRKILTSAEKSRNVAYLFTAYTGMGLSWEAAGADEVALGHFEKAVQLTEDLRESLSQAQRETFFDVRVSASGFYRTAPYEGLARVLVKLNKPLDAIKESEYTKGRMFSDGLSKRAEGSAPRIPKDVLEKDLQLNDGLAGLSKNLQKAYEKENKEVIAALEPQVKTAKENLATHIHMLRKQHPLFAATKYPQPMGLDQTALKDNEWLLEYHVTDPGIIIYLTRGKKLVKCFFKPVARKEVDDLVRKFREPLDLKPEDSLTKKLATFDFAAGKKLSDLILADVLPQLPKDAPLIIIPDGPLGVVPFEMLVLNGGGKITTDNKRPQVSGAEFFGDRNPISYYQSITALTLARTLGKQQKSGEKTLAMVDPVFSSDDPRLVKLARQEKEKLIANLPKEILMSMKVQNGLTWPRLPLTAELGESLKKDDPKTDLYEGMKAKKSVLLDKDLSAYRSIVFGTHGYFGKQLPGIMEPVLVLTLPGQPKGQDGFLRLSEVMGLKVNADVVALTACQTGLGRQISGEGTMGMGRAFQYAGAKSVLMSLWNVSEKASVNLVENFFKHMKEGKSKLEALRLARKEIRDQGYDHPFYWAPFILVGEVN